MKAVITTVIFLFFAAGLHPCQVSVIASFLSKQRFLRSHGEANTFDSESRMIQGDLHALLSGLPLLPTFRYTNLKKLFSSANLLEHIDKTRTTPYSLFSRVSSDFSAADIANEIFQIDARNEILGQILKKELIRYWLMEKPIQDVVLSFWTKFRDDIFNQRPLLMLNEYLDAYTLRTEQDLSLSQIFSQCYSDKNLFRVLSNRLNSQPDTSVSSILVGLKNEHIANMITSHVHPVTLLIEWKIGIYSMPNYLFRDWFLFLEEFSNHFEDSYEKTINELLNHYTLIEVATLFARGERLSNNAKTLVAHLKQTLIDRWKEAGLTSSHVQSLIGFHKDENDPLRIDMWLSYVNENIQHDGNFKRVLAKQSPRFTSKVYARVLNAAKRFPNLKDDAEELIKGHVYHER